MARREHERAADADREEIAERLRSAVGEGRLDLDEFDDRLARTYAAKTYGDLDRIVADLPRPVPVPRQPAPHPHPVRGWLAEQWRPWATVVLICSVIWLGTSILSQGAIYLWPIWVAVPWGVVLLCRSIYGLSSGEPQQWAKRPLPPGGGAEPPGRSPA